MMQEIDPACRIFFQDGERGDTLIQHKTAYWLLGILLVALCLVGMPMTGAAAEAAAASTAAAGGELPFKDMARYQWEEGKKAIQAMSRAKIINGFPDGTFRPSEQITRRQAAKIVAMAVKLPAAPANFIDVEPGLSYIGGLQQAGIVSGDENGRFRPDDSLTRAQLAKMIVLAYGLEMKAEPKLSDVPNTDLGQYVRIAASNGVMTGYEDGTFRPNLPVKRDQAAVMIYRAMQLAGGGQAPGEGADGQDGQGEGSDDGQGVEGGAGSPDAGNGTGPGHQGWSIERPFRLFVDAGHGGEDPGAIGKLANGNKIQEKDITLDIALEIARIFREEYAFVEVMLSRSEDIYIMLQERSRQANEWGADYFVSIHVNANDKASANGFESYIYSGPVSQETVDKQRIIHQIIVEKMGFRDRGMKRANFAVLRESRMPAILLENLFITNPGEAAQLNDPAFRKRLARAIAEAIATAWQVPRKTVAAMGPAQGTVDGSVNVGGTGQPAPNTEPADINDGTDANASPSEQQAEHTQHAA